MALCPCLVSTRFPLAWEVAGNGPTAGLFLPLNESSFMKKFVIVISKWTIHADSKYDVCFLRSLTLPPSPAMPNEIYWK